MRVRARVVLTAGVGLLLGGVGVILMAPRWAVPLLAAAAPGCTYMVSTSRPVVALTIDDGPDDASTPALLSLLAAHDAHATFFFISERVRGREALAARVVGAGHEIGNHMTRDEPSIRLSDSAFARELARADSVLRDHARLRWFRPGSGWYDATMLRAVRDAGYRCALGSVYPLDTWLPWPTLAARFILWHARPGAIIVLHEGPGRGERAVRTLRIVLPALERRGYGVVSLTELVERGTAAPRDAGVRAAGARPGGRPQAYGGGQ